MCLERLGLMPFSPFHKCHVREYHMMTNQNARFVLGITVPTTRKFSSRIQLVYKMAPRKRDRPPDGFYRNPSRDVRLKAEKVRPKI